MPCPAIPCPALLLPTPFHFPIKVTPPHNLQSPSPKRTPTPADKWKQAAEGNKDGCLHPRHTYPALQFNQACRLAYKTGTCVLAPVNIRIPQPGIPGTHAQVFLLTDAAAVVSRGGTSIIDGALENQAWGPPANGCAAVLFKGRSDSG